MNTKPTFKQFATAAIAMILAVSLCEGQTNPDYKSVDELLALITPVETSRANGEWKIANASEAWKKLLASKHKRASFAVKVERASKNYLTVTPIHRDGGGHPYDVAVNVVLPRDEPELWNEITQGQTIQITGIFGMNTISYRKPTELHMTISMEMPVTVKPAAPMADAPKAGMAVAKQEPPQPLQPPRANVPNPAPTEKAQVVTPIPPERGIVLDAHWDSRMQGGTATMRDLGELFSPHAKPSRDIGPHPELVIYEKVTYLMPLERAKEALGLKGRIGSKNKVACDGFPSGSLFHYGFSGIFEGEFNQLYIVTDKADQVVSIQLVNEHPREAAAYYSSFRKDKTQWHTYNFVNARTKAKDTMVIEHKVTPSGGGLRVDGVLQDFVKRKGSSSSFDLKALERVRWYVPLPLAGLIQECINKNANGSRQ